MRSSAGFSLALAALVASVGCTSAAGIVAEKAADSMDAAEFELAWIVHSMDGMTPSTTPEEAVNASATQAADFWTDGCFMFSIEGATITYTLTDCSGPLGIAQLSGTVAITYNDMGSGIGFEIVATGLTVRANTVSFMVTAEVSTDSRNATITSSGSVLGRRGHMLTRTGAYNLQWNPSSDCVAIDSGAWETVVEGETFSTNIVNWRRCGTSCPAAGTITFSGPVNTITLTYDGTRQVSWSAAGGDNGTLSLFCGEG